MKKLLVCLMVAGLVSVARGQRDFYFEVGGRTSEGVDLEVGEIAAINIVAELTEGYTATLTFNKNIVRGSMTIDVVPENAGQDAEAGPLGGGEPGAMLTVPQPSRAGVHFKLTYTARETGNATMLLAVGKDVYTFAIANNPASTGTGFSYQGKLSDGDAPAEGKYDFEFKLFLSPTGDDMHGVKVAVNNVSVQGGHFVVTLDPADGDGSFYNGDLYWLETAVRPGASNDPGDFVVLQPRQRLRAVPFAAGADTLDGMDSTEFAPLAHGHDATTINLGVIDESQIDPAIARDTEVASVESALTAELADKSDVGHYHDGSEIISGIISTLRIHDSIARDAELRWENILNIPADFADGVDNTGGGGDITAVYTGLGLDGGGSSGDVTLSLDVPLIISTGSQTQLIKVTNSKASGYGLEAEAQGSSGKAVYGRATSTTAGAENYGGYFSSAGEGGAGVRGVATSTSSSEFGPFSYGGFFEASGWFSRAVYGHATSTTQSARNVGGEFISEAGQGYGGQATANGSHGHAVHGVADGSNAYGGYFKAAGDEGVGVYARGGINGYGAILRGKVLIEDASTGSPVIELGKGLDYAEGFDVSTEAKMQPGTVLVIDEKNPGELAVSGEAYDTKVAGIVAGANGLGSGVRLGTGQFDCDVALAGRVYCNVDATKAAVKAGDMLTTSDVAGYAMKAVDYGKSRGAILGKAMEPLEEGKKGQILVLVTLQ